LSQYKGRFILPTPYKFIYVGSRDTLYPQKFEPTSPTGGGRSVGIVRSRTQATEINLVLYIGAGKLNYSRDISKILVRKISLTFPNVCWNVVHIEWPHLYKANEDILKYLK
jgi:hypothetical protein